MQAWQLAIKLTHHYLILKTSSTPSQSRYQSSLILTRYLIALNRYTLEIPIYWLPLKLFFWRWLAVAMPSRIKQQLTLWLVSYVNTSALSCTAIHNKHWSVPSQAINVISKIHHCLVFLEKFSQTWWNNHQYNYWRELWKIHSINAWCSKVQVESILPACGVGSAVLQHTSYSITVGAWYPFSHVSCPMLSSLYWPTRIFAMYVMPTI